MAHIIGTAGHDDLDGTDNADVIEGLAGNDTITGNLGADVIYGGDGDDDIRGDVDFSFGDGNDDVIYGGAGNDRLFGLQGNDQLFGGPGDDQMDSTVYYFRGAFGADALVGGPGNDSYAVDDRGDAVTELPGEGTDSVYSDVSYTLGPNVENLFLTGLVDAYATLRAQAFGTGNDLPNTIATGTPIEGMQFILSGLGGDDTLTGAGGDDILDGGTGADAMTGSTGNDLYYVDNTGDKVTEQADEGADTVFASITYTLPANVENLTLTGSAALNGSGNGLANVITGNDGDNTLLGLAGADTLNGGAGNDVLDGGTGADSMAGGSGNDTYFLDDAGDRIAEGAGEGTDEVRSTLTYILGPNLENLTLTGSEATNGTGNSLANVITGNTADNTLNGAGGFDIAAFSGAVASYHFTENGAQVTVSGPDGTDTLTNIEQLRFANLSFSIADRSHFDPLFYLNENPDVAAAALDPLIHYRSAGWTEGRDPNPSVDLASVNGLEYIASYGDLMAAFGANKSAGYQHFATTGLFEDRTITFDGLEYIASYSDLIGVFGANADAGATHYIGPGHTEGRQVTFDGLEYIASYGDLINAFHDQVAASPTPQDIGATHYIGSGYAEHRAQDLFDAAQYLANYADLQVAFGANTEAATLHYITTGYFEGRTDQIAT